MSEKKIKKTINSIEPEVGAKERMYNNIMKKAEQQKSKTEEPVQKPKAIRYITRYALPIAACFCLLILGIARFLPAKAPTEPDESNVLGGNPFVEVQSADDFKSLAITLDAPGGANEVSYAIIDGQIADVSFTLNEKSFTVRASAQEGDFSGLSGKVTSSEMIDAKTNAVLTKVQTDINTYYKIVWTNGKTIYCFLTKIIYVFC